MLNSFHSFILRIANFVANFIIRGIQSEIKWAEKKSQEARDLQERVVQSCAQVILKQQDAIRDNLKALKVARRLIIG